MSTFHPLARLFDSAGLTHDRPYLRADLHKLLIAVAREAVALSVVAPKDRRSLVVGYALWAAYQTRAGDRPRPSLEDFEQLAPAPRRAWVALGSAVTAALVDEVFA